MDAPSLSYRRLVANVAAGAGGRLAAIVIALALATVLVHALGAAAYGTWSFFFVLIGYHAQFDFGLSVAVERAVARAMAEDRPGRVAALLHAGLALALALSATLQVLLPAIPDRWLAGLGDPAAVRGCLLVLPLCLACSNAAAVAGAGLSGLQRTTTLAVQRTVAGGGTALVMIALALAGVRRLDVLLLVSAAGLLLTAVASWRAVAPAVGGLPLRLLPIDRDAVRELTRIGGTLQVTTLAAQLGDQTLRALLGARFGPAAMGTYDLASRAAIAPRSLMASLLVALVPFAAGRERAGGRAALSDSLQRSTRYAALMLIAGTVSGIAVAGPLMDVWLGGTGQALGQAQRLFELLLVSLGLQSIASPMVALGRAAGRPVPEALTTVVSQALGLALAAQMGTPIAAVAAMAVVITAAAGVLWVWLKHALGLSGLAAADAGRLGAVLAGAVAVGIGARVAGGAFAVPPWIALAAAPAAVTLATAALAAGLGCVADEERRLLVSRFGRLAS